MVSTDSISTLRADIASRPFVAKLHDWVTTVDHKRLGILYIVYALVFLLIGGIEATIMRIQLIRVLSASLCGVSLVRRYLRPEVTTPTRFLS